MTGYLDSSVVSSEYVYWQQDEAAIRAFLLSTNHGMGVWFDAQWAAAESTASDIFDPEQHDQGLPSELFHRDVGVSPADYFWQLSSAVIKDAVALYEILLEQLADQALRRGAARLATLETEDSWRWDECRLFYAHYVGVDVTPPRLEAVLWIRNKLAHLRDELRTGAGHAEFAQHVVTLGIDGPPTLEEEALGLTTHRPYLSNGVNLTQLQTWRLLDVIADQAGVFALAVFPYIYRRPSNSYLDALREKQPLPIPGFRTDKRINF